jgi:predicted nucleic acid-binding protein
MIDTQVLSFALTTEPAVDDKTKRIQRDCNALVSGFEEIRVSAITVLELLRGPPQVVAKIRASGILPLLRTEAFDGPIAEEVARILEAARSDIKSCARCLNVTGASPCPACGQLVSHQQKTHDAIIVATAARLHDVEVLYTCDQGVVELGRFVKNLRVEQPPNLDGPLFPRK